MNKVHNNRFEKFANIVTITGLLTILTTNTIPCIAQPTNSSDKIAQKAREYLQPLLHIGEPLTNVVERFGPPVNGILPQRAFTHAIET
jgi:hypothetical protein